MRTSPGVLSAAWSPRTRGLLILYDPESTSADAILNAMGERVESADRAAQGEQGSRSEQPPTVARAVVGTISELDRRVRRSTAGTLRLATLIPAALTLWAVSEIVRGRVAPLSWSSVLWYAHGLFRDYNPPA